MQAKSGHKKYRNLLVSRLALLMAACYLLYPFHHQFNSALHTLSHSLEAPGVVIGHPVGTQIPDGKIHSYHDKSNTDAGHRHVLIDFVSSIFEASEEQHEPGEVPITEITVDKHISTHTLVFFKTERKYFPKIFFYTARQPYSGYPVRLYKPPQNDVPEVTEA